MSNFFFFWKASLIKSQNKMYLESVASILTSFPTRIRNHNHNNTFLLASGTFRNPLREAVASVLGLASASGEASRETSVLAEGSASREAAASALGLASADLLP